MKNRDTKDRITKFLINNLPLLGLIVIILVFTALTGGTLLSKANIKSLINQSFLLMIACLGSIFVFLQGGVDLSMTNAIGMCSIMGAFALNDYGLAACVLAVLATGAVIGSLNGLVYAKTKISPFILTLSVNLILDGLNYTVTDQQAVIPVSRDWQKLFNGMGFKIMVLILFALICYYFYAFHRFGKQSRAVGASSEVAKQSGVNVRRVKFLAFFFAGLTSALYAFMAMMKGGGGAPAAGANVGFNVMMAMILGGSTMEGGLGASFKSCFVGAAITVVLTNALSMVGVSAMAQEVIRGVVFVIVVVFSTRLRDKQEGNRYIVRKKKKVASSAAG